MGLNFEKKCKFLENFDEKKIFLGKVGKIFSKPSSTGSANERLHILKIHNFSIIHQFIWHKNIINYKLESFFWALKKYHIK